MGRSIRGIVVAGAVTFAVAATQLGAMPQALALSSTADQTWMVNGTIYATAQSGNTIYIGGSFTRLRKCPAGQSCPNGVKKVNNLAAFNMTTGEPITGFAPAVTATGVKASVRSLAVSPDGQRLYFGGQFTDVDSNTRTNLAALNLPGGALSPSFKPPVGAAGSGSNAVYAIVATSTKVYVGGSFSKAGGKLRNKAAAFDTAGVLDANWKPTADAAIRAMILAPDGGTIFVAGAFELFDGASRQSVARISLDTGSLSAWSIPAGTIASPQTGWALDASSTRLYGGFGRGPNFFAAFALDQGNSGNQVWRTRTGGNVQAIALSAAEDRLFVGGHFGINPIPMTCNGHDVNSLAVASPSTGVLDCSWLPDVETAQSLNGVFSYTGVYSLLTTPTQLWVGGAFVQVSGVKQRGIARFTI